jgi:PleD family two-component response regulator
MGLVKDCVNLTRHWFRKRTVLNKIRVLVFDEDAAGSELLRSALLQESAAFVDETQSVASALEMHRRTPYHVILAGIQTGRGCV